VRFTQRDGDLYAILVDLPGSTSFSLRDVDARAVTSVRLFGVESPLDWTVRDGVLTVSLPERVPTAAAHVLALARGAATGG
jgi:alpha-L-fucosidase